MHAPLDVDPSRYEPTDAYTRNASLPLLTLSVVLPCAMEHRFMRPTARSVFAATPPDLAPVERWGLGTPEDAQVSVPSVSVSRKDSRDREP